MSENSSSAVKNWQMFFVCALVAEIFSATGKPQCSARVKMNDNRVKSAEMLFDKGKLKKVKELKTGRRGQRTMEACSLHYSPPRPLNFPDGNGPKMKFHHEYSHHNR